MVLCCSSKLLYLQIDHVHVNNTTMIDDVSHVLYTRGAEKSWKRSSAIKKKHKKLRVSKNKTKNTKRYGLHYYYTYIFFFVTGRGSTIVIICPRHYTHLYALVYYKRARILRDTISFGGHVACTDDSPRRSRRTAFSKHVPRARTDHWNTCPRRMRGSCASKCVRASSSCSELYEFRTRVVYSILHDNVCSTVFLLIANRLFRVVI